MSESEPLVLNPEDTALVVAFPQMGMVKEDMTFGKAYPGQMETMQSGFGNAINVANEAPEGVEMAVIKGEYTGENNARYPRNLADMLRSSAERALISTLAGDATIISTTGENAGEHTNGKYAEWLAERAGEGCRFVLVVGGTADNGLKFAVLPVVAAGMTPVVIRQCSAARAGYFEKPADGGPDRFEKTMQMLEEAGAIVVNNATDIRWLGC